jgi:excinuclease ABC subunit B
VLRPHSALHGLSGHPLRDAARAADAGVDLIREELRERLAELYDANKLVEAQRLRAAHAVRPGDDQGGRLLLRHRELLALPVGRERGSRRRVCIDYLPDNALLVIDESHQTIPQLGAMYKGDRSRKETLVEYGFRLPSALDNRPLRFEEWERWRRR